VHRFTGGSRLQEARAYASGEARAQLHDGHTINEKGKAVVHVRDVPLWHCETFVLTAVLRNTRKKEVM